MSTHTIVSGDTFWNLAQKYGISVDAILDANPGFVPEQLRVGQVIQIPERSGRSASTTHRQCASSENAPSHARFDTELNERVPSWCEQLRSIINAAARATGVPADLIAAVIYQESGGNVRIHATRNPNGGSDSGLMQVNQSTAAELQQKYPDRFSGISGSAKNVMLGASYLRDMFDHFGKKNWGVALRAYNSGPDGVDPRDLHATPAGTGDPTYVDKVFRFWVDISTGKDPPADHYSSV